MTENNSNEMADISDRRRSSLPQSLHSWDSTEDAKAATPRTSLKIPQQSLLHHRQMSPSTRHLLNTQQMSTITADAGTNTYGCIFLEVWVLSPDRTRLTRPPGGAWMDPAFLVSLSNAERATAEFLLDGAADTPLGVGLAGTIFGEKSSNRVVQWRQIKSVLTDPFVQKCRSERTSKAYQLGIGLVASTTFHYGTDSGIVLFYMRSTCQEKKSGRNEKVILEYTDYIGVTFAMIKTREECELKRKEMLQDAVRKVRKEVVKKQSSAGFNIMRLGSAILDKDAFQQLRIDLSDYDEVDGDGNGNGHNQESKARQYMDKLKKNLYALYRNTLVRVKSSPKKWSGVHLHGPPRHTFSHSITVFVWTFLAMLMILKVSTSMSHYENYAFDGAWYSSTLCILFALTPAPVGQPRQIIAGHVWNILVGMAVRQIPTNDFVSFSDWWVSDGGWGSMPLIWKQALACGIGVSGQAYFGILHPPATGLSLTFATNDKWSWGTILSVIIADIGLVALSVLMINLSEKGQYPLWWLGFGWEQTEPVKRISKTAGNVRRSTVQRLQKSSGTRNEECVNDEEFMLQ